MTGTMKKTHTSTEGNQMSVKGIVQRPMDREKFNNNWDSIFGNNNGKVLREPTGSSREGKERNDRQLTEANESIQNS
jgi:hypothetical protein